MRCAATTSGRWTRWSGPWTGTGCSTRGASYSTPQLERLQDDPRFLRIVDKLERFLAREREWYEAHKDDLVI